MAIDIPVPHADKITWKSDKPVWVDQWPLTSEKLAAATALVQEQLAAGHIEPTTSPWNTPIFVIKKKSGKWRLLQDLRKINETMVTMGALQPGLPSPVAIPSNYYKIVIDLKDCFFTIPLHPEDRVRFAFSLPVTNFKGPMPRFHWKVLPQGMANSPTLCQKFVAQVIDPFRKQWPSIYIIHYMDDILLAGADGPQLLLCCQAISQKLTNNGLQIAPEKVQLKDPYFYLGFELHYQKIITQKIQLKTSHLKTLNDFQKLLGDINWIRPYLKLTTGELKPLFDILKGDSDPSSHRSLTPAAVKALHIVEMAIQNQGVNFVSYKDPLLFVVCATSHTPTGVFWQQGPLLWIHLPASPTKILETYAILVTKLISLGREQSRQYFGKDPDRIILPYSKDQLHWLMQNTDEWPIACLSFSGIIDNHYPADKLLQFAKNHPFIFPKNTSRQPIQNASLVFTDGSSNGIAAMVIDDQTFTIQSPYRSAQLVELYAVVQVFQKLTDSPFNLYTDSSYIAQSVPLLETVPFIKPSTNAVPLFIQLQKLITSRRCPFFLGHLRTHSDLPGPLSAGNARADTATHLILSIELDPISQARDSHALHHLNAQTL